MQRSNIAIIGAAAVVIAACLVVTYLDSGDDSPVYPTADRDSVIGDEFVELVIHERSDGTVENLVYTMAVVGEYADGDQLIRYDYSDGTSGYAAVSGAYWKADTVSGEPDRTETILSSMYGAVECDVYVEESDFMTKETYFVSGTAAHVADVSIYGDGDRFTHLMYSSTIFGEAPGFPDTVVPDNKGALAAGDFNAYSYEYIGDDGTIEGTVLMYAASVEDGKFTGGLTNFEAQEGLPASYILGDPDAEGDGVFVIGTVYGDILCERTEFEMYGYEVTVFMGASDGVWYFMQMRNGSETIGLTLTGSSVLSSPRNGIGDYRQESLAGDHNTYVEFYETGSRIDAYTMDTFVTEVHGDGTCSVARYYDGRYSDSYIRSDTNAPEGDMVGTETVMTPFGTLVCDVYVIVSEGDVHIQWFSGGVLVKSVTETGGYTMHRYLVDTSRFSDGPTDIGSCIVLEPQVGDVVVDRTVTDTDGTVTESETVWTVVDVGHGTVVAENAGITWDFPAYVFYGFDVTGYESAGTVLIDTVYGMRLCDVYVLEFEGAVLTYFVGTGDGVLYASMLEEEGRSVILERTYGTGIF